MADDIDPIDPTICTNPDFPGDCCGSTFDHKQSPGLCAMCYIATKDVERAEIMKLLPWVKKTQIALLQSIPTTKTIQELQAEARRNAMTARTLQKSASKQSAGSGSLQVAAAKGVSRQIAVYLVPMTSTGTRTEASRILANATRLFPEDMLMADVLTHLLRHWNLDWEKDCSESLLRNISHFGQFFDTHDRLHGNHPKKILLGPSMLRLPSPAIYLEGFISINDFENDTGTLAPYFVHTQKENRKRKASQTNFDPDIGASKRTHSKHFSVDLLHRFPCALNLEMHSDSPKLLFYLLWYRLAQDGVVTIDWPNIEDCDTTPASMCRLQDTAFDQGKTKMVHKVICDGLPWVGKRFFNIGAGEGQVDIYENREQVIKEVTRLSKAGYFLTRFNAEAKRQGVDIDNGVQVTEFKLAVEVVDNTSGPSKASGFSLTQYQAALKVQQDRAPDQDQLETDPVPPILDPGLIVWLFEPRRSTKVKHWSGTNEYPPWHQNKLGSTLNTFAHYAYLFSLESTVFCDLQTAIATDIDGNGIEMLFDVMTHTLDMASGVGDHGKPGLKMFLEKHECGNRCTHLRLSQDGFACNSEPAGEDSEED
ncbi:kinase-like domain-containing protein [Mycena rebaudengoi]|nr:kinase-like domain-containing protein [Mycena rebaudengoi]